MFYDIIFLLQEYVFYPDSGKINRPRNSLANLSLRSTFKNDDGNDSDDDSWVGELFPKKLSIISLKSATYKVKHPKEENENVNVVKQNGDLATVEAVSCKVKLDGQFDGINIRRRSSVNSH